MLFLLTPLREGRPRCFFRIRGIHYFYSRPCGRGDYRRSIVHLIPRSFLLTPLREGRRDGCPAGKAEYVDFYSRPCGRGDPIAATI